MNPQEQFSEAVNENIRASNKRHYELIKGQVSQQQLQDEKAARDPAVAAYQEMREDRGVGTVELAPYVTHAELLTLIEDQQKINEDLHRRLLHVEQLLAPQQQTEDHTLAKPGDAEILEAPTPQPKASKKKA